VILFSRACQWEICDDPTGRWKWVGPRYGTDEACAWIALADDLLGFRKPKASCSSRIKSWETYKLGVNTPPIKTPHGWFTLYHAVGADKHYRLGALLLDLEDPSQVLHRTPDWLMQPEEAYELDGFYRGCVFPCGAVVMKETLFVYYGGATNFAGGDVRFRGADWAFAEIARHKRNETGARDRQG